jgi:RNase P subunit RPR2
MYRNKKITPKMLSRLVAQITGWKTVAVACESCGRMMRFTRRGVAMKISAR